MMLVLAMVVGFLPVGASAAKGDLSAGDTGLTGDINKEDTISLPIRLLDYDSDGMLFEYAEAYAGKSGKAAVKTAGDFGASKFADFTQLTATTSFTSNGSTIEALTSTYIHDYWADIKLAIQTGTYANYARMTWVGNSTNDWRNSNAAVLLTDFKASVNLDTIRYAVIVYRTNVEDALWLCTANGSGGAGTTGHQAKFTMTKAGEAGDGSDTNWTYGIYDLKTGGITDWTTTTGIYAALPMDASGDRIDIAHIAYFDDADKARAFGEYAITDGSDRGDNRGFGLLRGSRTQSSNGTVDDGRGSAFNGIYKYNNTAAKYGNAAATITQMGWTTDPISVSENATNLGYTLLGDFSGIANLGLLESTLGENGYPVYKEEVVTYLAYLLEHSLKIDERTSNGWKNYRYVQGTPSAAYGGVDLASALRSRITGLGDYDSTKAKNLVGNWNDVKGNITTYFDAAYFMLNSIFMDNSYNKCMNDYDYLVLSSAIDTKSGDKVYVFDGGFTSDTAGTSAVKYDTTKKTIQNSSAAQKTLFSYNYDSDDDVDSWTTLNPFLPITSGNDDAGQTKNPYYQDDGVINAAKKQVGKDSLYQRDFNFAMVSEGQFTYYADDELFFEFEGDDDVYLFINDELVMDIGSAHSIDYYRFELNDYVNAAKAGTLGSSARNKALALEDGNVYSFKFYYMERHSYGSNIRICTNIRVTDPSMETAKTAWQDGTQLDFGSVVDKDKVVEYGFAITNNGEENLYDLTFTDNDIGVKLDPTNGLTITGSRVYDVNGGTLEVTDLTAVVTHPDYDDINITFDDNDGLKDLLRDMTASEETENGQGLFVGATLTIRGIGYKLSEAQTKEGGFDNTVLTSANNSARNKPLQGQATMRVFVPADPMYYEWAGHDLKVSKTKLITDIIGAVGDPNNPLYDQDFGMTIDNVTKIELVSKGGTAITSPYVTINSSYELTINYPTAGSKVFYVKVTYNSSKNDVTVPVLVNVTDVKDSVFVLDYGLQVNLSEGNELHKNDTLTVPGRNTAFKVEGMASDEPSYSPNNISFVQKNGPIKGNDGEFTFENFELKYKPTSFMDDLDTVYIAIRVHEADLSNISDSIGTVNINKEVEMYKSVSVLPANVVYYEDDFPAITYTGSETQDNANSFVSLKEQSNNQDQEYGQDDVYQGSEDSMSGGSLTTIAINNQNTVASFIFKGTGFELIGRTNAKDSGSLIVRVKDENNKIVKTLPVITQFDNENDGGDEGIFQVPVIRVKDLSADAKQYTVEISGVPAKIYDENGNVTGTKTTYLYVDGLRIYQPVEGVKDNAGVDLEDNYNENEQNAEFIELRDEIVQGIIAVAEYSDTDFKVATATSTWTENLAGESEEGLEFNEVDSVADYLMEGPNNEVYMTGTYNDSALVFYVKEVEGASAHSLQLALRGIDETLFMSGIDNGVNATVSYGVMTDTGYAWQKISPVITFSTEQYFKIDYTKCFFDEAKGAYQVVVRVDDGMVSYSSLKLTGLELLSVNGDSTDLRYINGILNKYVEAIPTPNSDGDALTTEDEIVNDTLANYVPVDEASYVNFASVKEQMAATTVLEAPEEEVEPVEPDEGNDVPSYSFAGRLQTIKKILDLMKRIWGK